MKKPGSKELTTIESAQRYSTEAVSYWVGAGRSEVESVAGYRWSILLVFTGVTFRLANF